MNTPNQTTTVSTAAELADAVASSARDITIVGEITGAPMITLPPGTVLRGGTLRFGAKGVRLTTDNTLEGVTVITADDEVAILNDTSVAGLGTLALHDVRVNGQVLLLADGAVRSGHVEIDGLAIETADVRGRDRRPHGFGVEALQGALTVWNLQSDPDVVVTADVRGVSAGSQDDPVRGSGVFLGGHGDWAGHGDGGVLRVSRLHTGEIHTNGGIPSGTPDLISGGVFVISGAEVDEVVNSGPVTTYGQNDMVLDNWGSVREWRAEAPVTSYGSSGIGFVNFGDLRTLRVQAPITTHGRGARGFNLYDGSLDSARFASITTTADGAVGVQISMPMGSLSVDGDIATSGGEAMSLVKGVQTPLKAIAVSIKPGGTVRSITVGGAIRTAGAGVPAVEIDGIVETMDVAGGVHEAGPADVS